MKPRQKNTIFSLTDLPYGRARAAHLLIVYKAIQLLNISCKKFYEADALLDVNVSTKIYY